jgi:hypothetical protein
MKKLVAGLAAVAVLSSSPLFADKPEKSKGKSKGHEQDAAVVVTFSADQRQGAQAYFVEKHGRGGCPPGLAKKNNGCLPPGQAKKRYTVGHALARGHHDRQGSGRALGPHRRSPGGLRVRHARRRSPEARGRYDARRGRDHGTRRVTGDGDAYLRAR